MTLLKQGTVQFVWGLDPEHDGSNVPANREMQQLTVNLLADMNVQPVTLAANLVASGPSSDTTGPTAQITSPVDGADVPIGSLVISGTATDVGGVVGGVEVSYDNGVRSVRVDKVSESLASFVSVFLATIGQTFSDPPTLLSNGNTRSQPTLSALSPSLLARPTIPQTSGPLPVLLPPPSPLLRLASRAALFSGSQHPIQTTR